MSNSHQKHASGHRFLGSLPSVGRPGLPPDTPYEAWFFGDTRELANELTELVLSGKKTATASLYWEYEADREALPLEDGYSVITDFDGNPRGIIQTHRNSHPTF